MAEATRLLTVGIPTYDRPAMLRKTLEVVLPQMTPECELLVLDNCSSVPVAEAQRELLDRYPDVARRVVRNPTNIGGNANILRLFETCATPYLWTLGDDDRVREDAIATTLRTIREQPDADFLNFLLPWLAPREPARSVGWHDFVRALHRDSTFLMSLNVYRVARARAGLRLGYQFITANLPHIALLVEALGETGVAYFSPESNLYGYGVHEDGPKKSWPVVSIGIARTIMLELPMDYETRRLLLAKLLANFQIHENVTMRLVVKALRDGDSRDALFFYDMYCYRNYYFERSLKRRLLIPTYRLLVRFPRLGRRVISYFDRRRKDAQGDWFERCLGNESADRF